MNRTLQSLKQVDDHECLEALFAITLPELPSSTSYIGVIHASYLANRLGRM